MNRSFRPLAWLLAVLLLLTTGCSALHSCLHADDPDVQNEQREKLREKLEAERPTGLSASEPSLRVVVIDVGQGDSILLVSPEGKSMLVDAGPADAFDRIADALAENGVSALDVVVATHPHEDHIGSMAAVLDAYPVGAFYTIADELPTPRYAAMRAALERNGCPVLPAEAGMTIPWADSCTVTILNPIPAYADEPAELNDLSVVLHVKYGETAVLLTGDAGALAENRMLDTFPRSMLRADLLKLGHHGSQSATGYSFFLAVDPDLAVASCAKENDYGHPHLETLSLLYDTRTAFFCTDRDGTITFRLDGTSVAVEPVRKEPS